jgi:hypothetical protein
MMDYLLAIVFATLAFAGLSRVVNEALVLNQEALRLSVYRVAAKDLANRLAMGAHADTPANMQAICPAVDEPIRSWCVRLPLLLAAYEAPQTCWLRKDGLTYVVIYWEEAQCQQHSTQRVSHVLVH